MDAKKTVDQQLQAQNYAVCDTLLYILRFFWLRVALKRFFAVPRECWRNSKTSAHVHIYLLVSTLTEGTAVWLLEPAMKAFKIMAICKNEASQMRECVLFPITFISGQLNHTKFRTQEYTRTCGRCLAMIATSIQQKL